MEESIWSRRRNRREGKDGKFLEKENIWSVEMKNGWKIKERWPREALKKLVFFQEYFLNKGLEGPGFLNFILNFGGHSFWVLAKSDTFIPNCNEGGGPICPKKFSGIGGFTPLYNRKNPLSSILQLPRQMNFFIDVDFGVGWVDGGGVGGWGGDFSSIQ